MIIAHDLGTTGDKATLVSPDGELLASVTVGYGVDFGPGGKAEQSPADWWDAFVEANRKLLDASGTAPSAVDAVSFSGQMMGVVPLDSAGEVIRPAIIWADTRSHRQTARLVDRVGMRRGYAITGHRLNPTYSLSKIMWLADTEPDVARRATVYLQAKDYLVYRLTGAQVTDPSDASGTNAFDQVSGGWSSELLEAAGVSPRTMPEIVASTTVVGSVVEEAARLCGLLAGTPVVVGGGDGPMAALGAGIIDDASGAYAYLGSSSWVSISAEAPLHDDRMRSMTFNHVIPGQFVPTATMQAGGGSLQWVTSLLAPERADRYRDLLDAATSSQAAGDGLYFLPHLLGERSPYWNPRARAAFVGLLMHHGRGNLTRAVLEGVAFNLRTGLVAFAENGRPVAEIDVIGGAANADLFLTLAADIWGVPVNARNLVDEGNAIGAAVVAGVGVGLFDDFAATTLFSDRTSRREPDPIASGRYQDCYAEFMDAYRRLEPWFDDLRPTPAVAGAP